MYTQCPDCQVAFRITAEVLQQARGRVRCGSCGEAFNALDHLSESPPVQSVSPLARDPREEERSRELMQTLDRLAGPEDVRIEDTGIEWRVVDDEGDPRTADEDAGFAGGAEQTGERQRDLQLDDEPRYDDNTPLPDDFSDEEDTGIHETPMRRSTDYQFVVMEDTNESQTELELSEPDDWMDLLDEVVTPENGDEESVAEAIETAPTGGVDPAVSEDSGEAHRSEPAADPVAEQSASQDQTAEVPYDIEIDESDVEGLETIFEEGSAGASDEDDGEVDVVLEHTDDDGDLDMHLEAVSQEDGDLDVVLGEASEDAEDLDLDVGAATDDDSDLDVVLEKEADGDDSLDVVLADEDRAEADEPDLAFGEEEADEADDSEQGDTQGDSDGDTVDGEASGRKVAPDVDDIDSSGEFERAIEFAEQTLDDDEADEAAAQADAAADLKFDPDRDSADLEDETPKRSQADDEAGEDDDELFLAMTANMQIDPEVLRQMKAGDLPANISGEDGIPMVETIIMEGDAVRGTLDDDLERSKERASSKDPGSMLDTYISSREPEKRIVSAPVIMGLGIAFLTLSLFGQYVHAQRETLATYGLFDKTVGPVYRMLGSPVTPRWDVKGWQFETTSGSTAGDDGLLSISSRISNRSQQPLPYPLVHVSLTDRYEEVIGSRILEPDDYLNSPVGDRALVAAGENFTAKINIASTSADATGFKLNVCYRETAGSIRCAIEDFKER